MRDVRDARGWLIVALVCLLADVGGAVVAVGMIFSGFWMIAILGVLGLIGTALVARLLWDMVRECWDDLQRARGRNMSVVVAKGVVYGDPDRVAAALATKQKDDRLRSGL